MDSTVVNLNGNSSDGGISNHASLDSEDVEVDHSFDNCELDGSIESLSNENKLLREILAASNASMKLAYEQFAASKEVFDKAQLEFEEKCNQAKKIIACLREEITQKDGLISALKEGSDGSGVLEFESLRSQLTEMKKSEQLAIQERDDLRNKCVSFEMQYKSLVTSSDLQKKQDEQTFEGLQKNIMMLKLIQIKDHKEKQDLSGSLSHLRLQFDDLISEYEKLILDEKNRKAVLLTKETELNQLQGKVQNLEKAILQHQNMTVYYRSHFEAERQARQELNNQCITLKAHLMRLSSSREKPPVNPSGPSSLNARSKRDVCVCPKCGHEAPNIEALQRHCHSCGD